MNDEYDILITTHVINLHLRISYKIMDQRAYSEIFSKIKDFSSVFFLRTNLQ